MLQYDRELTILSFYDRTDIVCTIAWLMMAEQIYWAFSLDSAAAGKVVTVIIAKRQPQERRATIAKYTIESDDVVKH